MEDALLRIAGWMPALLQATVITAKLTVISVSVALVLGFFLAIGKISSNPLISKPASAYVFLFRGTPLLIQLLFIYYVLPELFPVFDLKDPLMAAYVAFSLNVAAYLAEIIRAAIQSIDKGQMEAARSLGLTHGQAMRLVIIPQSYRRMIPPICNEFVMVLKDTSIVAIISLPDLAFKTSQIAATKSSQLVYLPAAAIYLVLTAGFTILFNWLEKKFSLYE
ncbi:MAG: amino acid ABC transporter permease [Clostridiales Family XIII bacterium]|nr:amino acid ABC transporter permease [Clostridiales Family XIII bacterium]